MLPLLSVLATYENKGAKKIASHNTEIIEAATLEACKVICLEREWCLSIEYRPHNYRCSMSKENSKTKDLTDGTDISFHEVVERGKRNLNILS